MPLTIEIPDDIAIELGADATERLGQARELIALELYREGRISLRTMGTPRWRRCGPLEGRCVSRTPRYACQWHEWQ